ncbi:MAG: ATP-binding protein [Candidatus Omnitrophica bacterium]|nr:ATP-binding protein [Candidatus Omnitrophota bacterium]
MDKKEAFKKIIVESRGLRPELVRREVRLPTDLQKVITLYGPRRSGKTYLFYQTMLELAKEGVPAQRMLYVNFEDERILPFSKDDWEILLEAFFELYPENVGEKTYLFLDEAQEAPYWDKFVRRMSEKKEFRIFLTGSSSKLLSQEIATSLRGRTISYFLAPFSFHEALLSKGIKVQANVEHSPQRHLIKKEFLNYLKFGGFPETLEKEDPLKIRILQEYFELVFYRDIVERHKIRNYTLMKELMRYLVNNFASLFSIMGYYNLLKSSGQKTGKDTVCEYVSWLEDVNFVKFVQLYDYSIKRRVVNPKKIYCIDTGLITAVASQFSENKGRYLENAIYLELLRRGKEIFYWKDGAGGEVDFLMTERGKPRQLIQATARIEDNKAKERELAPLLAAAEKFKIDDCLILTDDQGAELSAGRIKIKVRPIWSWLLEKRTDP